MLNEDSNSTLVGCSFSYNYSGDGNGGGICSRESNVGLKECTFIGNVASWHGGGMANYDSNVLLADCTFAENVGEVSGGGMSNGNSSLLLTDCTFNGNGATEWGGAGMACRHCSIELFRSTFSGNVVSERWGMAGGGILNIDGSDTKLANCTFAENWAPNGRAVACYSGETAEPGNVDISNCILWDGGDEIWNENESAVTVTYSNVQGGWPGRSGAISNIAADPCFAEYGYWETPPDFNSYTWYRDAFWIEGDYHLKSQGGRWDVNDGRWTMDDVTSPCIDGGDPMSPIGFEGFPNGGIVNMGAYGGTAEASKSYFGGPVCETIVAGDVNGDCAVDFVDFRLMALHWMEDNAP
jgi:predicted outer membrane repeat protein